MTIEKQLMDADLAYSKYLTSKGKDIKYKLSFNIEHFVDSEIRDMRQIFGSEKMFTDLEIISRAIKRDEIKIKRYWEEMKENNPHNIYYFEKILPSKIEGFKRLTTEKELNAFLVEKNIPARYDDAIKEFRNRKSQQTPKWDFKNQGVKIGGEFFPTPGHKNHSLEDIITGKQIPLNVHHFLYCLNSTGSNKLNNFLETFEHIYNDQQTLQCIIQGNNLLFDLERIIALLKLIEDENYPKILLKSKYTKGFIARCCIVICLDKQVHINSENVSPILNEIFPELKYEEVRSAINNFTGSGANRKKRKALIESIKDYNDFESLVEFLNRSSYRASINLIS